MRKKRSRENLNDDEVDVVLLLQSISPTTTINCKSELLVGWLKEYTIEFKCGEDLR